MSGPLTIGEVATIINAHVREVREGGSSLIVHRSSLADMVEAAFQLGQSRGVPEAPSSDKPPLGLRPENVADEEFNRQRIEEIRQAMGRYIAAGMEFPAQWVEELHLRTAGRRALELDGLITDRLNVVSKPQFPQFYGESRA